MRNIEHFLENYNSKFSKISNINKDIKKKIIKLHKLMTNIKKNKKKTYSCW